MLGGEALVLYRKILVTCVVAIGVLLCFMAISASPAWAEAVLKVDKRGPATVEKDQVFDYEIDVTNTGNPPAKGVKLKDTVPDGTKFVSVSPDACEEDSGDVTCDLGKINDGDKNVTLTVRADGTKDNITNTATATDRNNLEDSDTAETKIGSDNGNRSGANNDSGNDSGASGGAVKLTCEQLIKLAQGAAASQYSVEVSQKCEGSANVVGGTVPSGTLADTGGPLFGFLVAGLVLAGGGILLRLTLRR